MEKRTIGQFIAVLRKASGMSQRQLAERLNVSDKTVSRWERDESTPDLTLIPVLAEIFNVTADELLRGDRNPMHAAAPTVYAEEKRGKQEARLLSETKTRHQIRSLIALGVAGIGLITAAIANLGFNKALVGFLLSLAFSAAAVICELIFAIRAFSAVGESEKAGDAINQSRLHLYRHTKQTMVAIGSIFGFCVPLTFAGSAGVGLTAGSWLGSGLLTGIGMVAALLALGLAADAIVQRKALFLLNEKQTKVFESDLSLGKWCAGVTAAAMGVTLLVNLAMAGASPQAWATGIRFDDFASFGAYMEQEIPESDEIGMEALVSYDEYGNIVDESEWRRHTMMDREGQELFSFIWNNRQASTYSYSLDSQTNEPRIYVYTNKALRLADEKIAATLRMIYAAYVIEMLAGIGAFLLLKKRKV